jgi:hypothetical protein
LSSSERKAELLPVLVEKFATGEYGMRQLAAEHGLSRVTLYKWLLSAVGDAAYKDLVTDALVARIAEADEDLDGAKSVLEVQKAREKARFARMDFERRRPSLYGVKQEVEVKVAPVLHIHAPMPEGGRTLESIPVPPALPAPPDPEQ